ncbi:MerR family transcriptional regulator [Rhodococcoides fascians]|uniref:MerR family transcriptional regulator n=1 Tax=Rhodococcoides fascians TaxID=1828 RepID=UPI0009B85F57|nr:MerR family DNA-binding transcriptional regulator [Rhodococcus fascians]
MTDSHTYPSEVIAIGEAAEILGISVKTLRNWEAKGAISAIRSPGGQRRFRRTDVDALLSPQQSA